MICTSWKSGTGPISDGGSVLLELLAGIGVLIVLCAGIADFGFGFQNFGGAVNSARDLARAGAGYDLNEYSGASLLSTCEFVCSRATTTLCSYGLNPSAYSVTVGANDSGDMFVVDISNAGQAALWQFALTPVATATFTLEGPLTAGAFDSSGCGVCTTAGCS